jgi:hypothetical protein
MEPEELESAIASAGAASQGKNPKEKAKVMRGALEGIAKDKGYLLALRK